MVKIKEDKSLRMARIRNADNTGKQWELSFTALEMQNVPGSLEDSLAVSYKSKHTLTL